MNKDLNIYDKAQAYPNGISFQKGDLQVRVTEAPDSFFRYNDTSLVDKSESSEFEKNGIIYKFVILEKTTYKVERFSPSNPNVATTDDMIFFISYIAFGLFILILSLIYKINFLSGISVLAGYTKLYPNLYSLIKEFYYRNHSKDYKKYHGAEHMVTNAWFSNTKPINNKEFVRQFSRRSNKCGTPIAFLNMLWGLYICFRTSLLLKYSIKKAIIEAVIVLPTLFIIYILGGLDLIQYFVTQKPDDKHLDCVIYAFEEFVKSQKETQN